MSFEYLSHLDIWQTGEWLGIKAALGLIPNVSIVRKVAYNPDVDTGTLPEDVWSVGGIYTGFPDTAETMEIFSTSASDTSNGSGVRTISVIGLDENWNEITEVVTMNGLTSVFTVNKFRRFLRSFALTSDGSNQNTNAGDITFRHSTTTANVFGKMLAGNGTTREGCYTVPAGYTGVLKTIHNDIDRSVTSAIAGDIYIRPFNQPPRFIRPFSCSSSYPSADDLVGGVVLTEKTDFIPRVRTCSANNTPVYSKYEIVLLKNV